MKKLIILFLITQFIVQDVAFAYPIEPRPLRELVIESEYIAWVYVKKTERIQNDSLWAGSQATLKIKKIFQGRLEQNTIQVLYTPNLICPAPPSYPEKKNLLVFLNKSEKGFYTHALSYGTKELNRKEMKIYEKRIVEMQQILKIKNEQEQFDETLQWLIRCAQKDATRWEGVYELSPESDFMSFYDNSKDKYKYTLLLSETQINQLRAVALHIDTFRYYDLGLIDLVRKEGDTELASFLTQHLKGMDANDFFIAIDLMKRIAYCYGRNDLYDIIREIDEKDILNMDDLTRQHYINRFIAEI